MPDFLPLPRESCLGDPVLIWEIVTANIVFLLSYTAIPLGIMRVMAARGWKLPLGHMVALFATFIFPCGLGHGAMAIVVFWPVYHLEAWLMMIGAAISAVVAVVFWSSIASVIKVIDEFEGLRDAVETEANHGG